MQFPHLQFLLQGFPRRKIPKDAGEIAQRGDARVSYTNCILVIQLAILWNKSLQGFVPFDQNFLCTTRHSEHLQGHNSQQGSHWEIIDISEMVQDRDIILMED